MSERSEWGRGFDLPPHIEKWMGTSAGYSTVNRILYEHLLSPSAPDVPLSEIRARIEAAYQEQHGEPTP